MSTSLEMIQTALNIQNKTTKPIQQKQNEQHLASFKNNNHEADYQKYTSNKKL